MTTIVATSHPSPPSNDLNDAEMGNGNNVVKVNGISIQGGNNHKVTTINGVTYVNGVEIPPGAHDIEVAKNDVVIIDGVMAPQNSSPNLVSAIYFSITAASFSIAEACIIFIEYMLAATITKCGIYALMTIILFVAICYRKQLWIYIACIVSTGVIIIFNIISSVLIFLDLPIFADNVSGDFGYVALYIVELLADGLLLWHCIYLYIICRRNSKAKKEKCSKHAKVHQPQPDDQVQKLKKTEKSKSQTKTQNLGLNESKINVMSKPSQKQIQPDPKV